MRKKRLNWHIMLVPVFLMLHACGDDPAPAEEPMLPGNIATIAGFGPTQWGHTGDGGPASEAALGWIISIDTDSAGNIYLADGAANTLRKISASDGIINTICGQFIGYNVVDPTPYTGDGGPATAAHIRMPLSVDVDVLGRVTFIDAGNLVIRQIAADGTIATVAGNGDVAYNGDGGPATEAAFHNPYSVAADA